MDFTSYTDERCMTDRYEARPLGRPEGAWANAGWGVWDRTLRRFVPLERHETLRRWQARAEAIASYYRQLKDNSMVVLAQRIKLRAARRLGELLGIADRTIEVVADLPLGGHAPDDLRAAFPPLPKWPETAAEKVERVIAGRK
jgi:hypothetical protein